LLGSPLLKTLKISPDGAAFEEKKPEELSSKLEKVTNFASSEEDASHEYDALQRSIFQLTLVVSAFTVCLTAIFGGFHSSISVLVGALSGLAYLRLLARSIGRLGKYSESVSKAQLLVPVILVVVAARSPYLELLPSLVGFLLYKPSLIIQFIRKP